MDPRLNLRKLTASFCNHREGVQTQDAFFCAQQRQSHDCCRMTEWLGCTGLIVSAAVTVATATVRTNVAHFVKCKLYFPGEFGETGADGHRGK